MGKTGIFYGSTLGNTRFVAEKMGKLMPDASVLCVKDVDKQMLEGFDHLIIGTSTWGGGGFQDDYFRFSQILWSMDLSNTKVALFGLGDQINYPDTFCDGMGKLYQIVVAKGAKVVGAWPADDYNFSESDSFSNGMFVGLALDEDNEPDLTDYRIKAWVRKVTAEFAV